MSKYFYNKCIYAIKHSNKLDKLIGVSDESHIEENKIWRSAYEMLDEARKIGKVVPVVFAPAETTEFLHSYAELINVEFQPERGGTIYTIKNLQKFKSRLKKTSLVKLDGNHILDSYIRSYCLCKTPVSLVPFAVKRFRKFSDNLPIDLASPPEKVEASITRIIRDTPTAQKIKNLYNFRCQICNTSIDLNHGKIYIEVHHIYPLSKGGFDIESNMIVVCPNHHALFDYSSVKFISHDKVLINKTKYSIKHLHDFDQKSIEYNNRLTED